MSGAARITDGIITDDGMPWDSSLAAKRYGGDFSATVDLPSTPSIRALGLQGDNNDQYEIQGQLASGEWIVLWLTPTVPAPGLQTREIVFPKTTPPIKALRVTSRWGDGNYSLSEVYASCSEVLPTLEKRFAPSQETVAGRDNFRWICGLIFMTAVGVAAPRNKRLQLLLGLAVIALSVWTVYRYFSFDRVSQDLLVEQRTVLALAGIFLCVSMLTGRLGLPLRQAAFSALALLAVCNYLQWGNAEFRTPDGAPSWPHLYDLRNYYPAAKYFKELGYEGVYDASLGAFEDLSGNPVQSLHGVRVRNLSTLEASFADSLEERVAQMRGKFSPSRWADFTTDMRYFLTQLGAGGYLGSLADHGANATPAWMFIASIIFRFVPASDAGLTLTGGIDLLLLLLAGLAIGRTFGVRVALLCAIVFGTSDIPYFGTSWLGATLRYDWFAALAFGICALKERKYTAGGALLTLAGMLRVFPLVALAGAAVPLLIRFFRRKKIRRPALLQIAKGSLVTAIVLFILPIIAFGYSASWGKWISRIERHDSKSNTNSLSWRMAVSYDSDFTAAKVFVKDAPEPWIRWQQLQEETLRSRKYLYWGGQLLALLGLIFVAGRARPHEAALLALFLVPILANPAQYYLHYIALIPILFARSLRRIQIDRPAGMAAVIILLGFAVAQFFARRANGTDVAFAYESFGMLFTLGTILTAFAASRHALFNSVTNGFSRFRPV